MRDRAIARRSVFPVVECFPQISGTRCSVHAQSPQIFPS